MRCVGIDGHDGAGKSTLAALLADRLGVECRRLMAEPHGSALMAAADAGDTAGVIEVGRAAFSATLEADAAGPVILDRSWITVASLVPWETFRGSWDHWVPTVLCWADLDTTLSRLAERSEAPQPVAWHEHYLAVYAEIAAATGTPVVRTDGGRTVEEAADELVEVVDSLVRDA